MSGRTRLSYAGGALVLLLSLAACSSGAPASHPSTSSSALTSNASPARPDVDAGAINLDCSYGMSIQSPGRQPVLGIDTDVARVAGTDSWRIGKSGEPSYRGRTMIKSPLTVDQSAAVGTRVVIESPSDARLYYTSWSVWSDQPVARTMITGSRGKVMIGGSCGSVLGFPGGIVVSGPSCVTIAIIAPDGRNGRIRVPLGTPCPQDGRP